VTNHKSPFQSYACRFVDWNSALFYLMPESGTKCNRYWICVTVSYRSAPDLICFRV